jgi:hypothetical protein
MNQEKEKNKSVLFGLILLLVALFAPVSRGQVTNLGKLTITTGIAWDKNAEPDIAGYYVYARPSNNAAAIYRVPTLTNQIGARDLIGTNANGNYIIYLTAVNTAGLESGPSIEAGVTYARTNIAAPSNLQFFLITVATNLIPLQALK